MSYVDAIYDKKLDLIRVVERVGGNRLLVDHKPEYNFYIADPRVHIKASMASLYKKFVAKTSKSFARM